MDFENLTTEGLSDLSTADLTAAATAKRAFAKEVADKDAPSAEDVAAANEALEVARQAKALAASRTALQAALDDEEEEDEPVEEASTEASDEGTEEADDEGVEEAEDEGVEEASTEAEPVQEAAPKGSRVQRLAGKVDRPKAPAVEKPRVSITAAAEVPGLSAGTALDLDAVGEGLVERLKAFGTPNGVGQGNPGYQQDLRKGGVAKFQIDFPDDLKVERNGDHLEVLKRAGDEKRLKSSKGSGSLTAAGGWCAPSETIYDLCEGETLDGLLSMPEVQVNRGGINFTKGPDYSAIYDGTGFCQTEAEAEAGTVKDCYEVPCPPFTEVRLDACGLCIMVPILTNAAYPELTQRVIRGAMVAHQHKMNAKVLAEMTTIAGTAISVHDFGGSAQNTLANLELVATLKRQQYALGMEETLEVVAPFWLKPAIRNDLALRQGRPIDAITDAVIQAEFAARRLAVQWVYDWQPLPTNAAIQGYPATVNVLMYPAGTFVKGVADVINLSAVYDAASLSVNTYTGLFFEEGILVANTCFDADLVTIPICGAGRTGAADVVECGIGTEA